MDNLPENDTVRRQEASYCWYSAPLPLTPAHLVWNVGQRQTQEDRYGFHLLGDNVRWYGVYDGHGGSAISRALVDLLPRALARQLSPMSDSYFEDQKRVTSAIQAAFLEADMELWAEASHHRMGSTVTGVLVIEPLGMAYLVNLGDSRTVAFHARTGEVVLSTHDHKATDVKEQERIKRNGGFVTHDLYGHLRVKGDLAITRALGDWSLEFMTSSTDYPAALRTDTGVISKVPDVFPLRHSSRVPLAFIAASDGLWDTRSNEEIVNLTIAGQEGIDRLDFYTRNTMDNVTVAIVDPFRCLE